MQLSFLGQPYQASTPAIETTETEATLTFLGRRSKVKQYNVTQHHPSGDTLTFRGCRYTR